MPNCAASLRRSDRGVGLVPAVLVATAALLVACGWFAPDASSARKPEPNRGANLDRLWSEFPLRDRHAANRPEVRVPTASPRPSQPRAGREPRILSSSAATPTAWSDRLSSLQVPLLIVLGVLALAAAIVVSPLPRAPRRRAQDPPEEPDDGSEEGTGPQLRLITTSTEEEPANDEADERQERRDEQLVAVLNERPASLGPTALQAAKQAALVAVHSPEPHAPPEPRGSSPAPEEPADVAHVLFVPTDSGYLLASGEGQVPRVGTRMDGAGLGVDCPLVVSKVGRSPLPLDQRRCAYLERW